MAKVTVYTEVEARAAGIISEKPIIDQFADAVAALPPLAMECACPQRCVEMWHKGYEPFYCERCSRRVPWCCGADFVCDDCVDAKR